MRILRLLSIAILVMILSACGGGDDSEQTAATPYTGPSDGTGVMKSNAYLLDSTAAKDSTFTNDILTVKKPQQKMYQKGDVIVLDAHDGRLLKVISATESADSIVYQVQSASLTDVFSKLSVAFKGELTASDLGESFPTNDPEIEVSWANRSSGSTADGKKFAQAVGASTNTIQIKYKKIGVQTGSGIEIDGTSSFVLNPDFFLDLKEAQGNILPTLELGATISPNLSTSVSVSSLYGGQISYILDKSIPLPAFKRIIVVPVLGVPVPIPFWIKPVIKISGSANGTAGSKFVTTNAYSVEGTFGFRKTVAEGAKGFATASDSSTMDVTDVESEFGVNLVVPRVEIQFLIYSFAGPNFDIGLEAGVAGKSTVSGAPPVEGVGVDATAKIVVNGGLKASLDFKNIDALKALLGDLSVRYSAFSLKLYENPLAQKKWFFPYKGAASVIVRDNGRAPDDIFEVSLDGSVIGLTTKGGSGQFRLKNLKPGNRTLTIKTVEDDAPPGTYEVSLGDSLTFEDGTISRSGELDLGQSLSFSIVVPK